MLPTYYVYNYVDKQKGTDQKHGLYLVASESFSLGSSCMPGLVRQFIPYATSIKYDPISVETLIMNTSTIFSFVLEQNTECCHASIMQLDSIIHPYSVIRPIHDRLIGTSRRHYFQT